MKRFSKILTLILALVIIVTAFTVVALAEDEPTYYVKTGAHQVDLTFDSFPVDYKFEIAGKASTTGSYIRVKEAYPGGNKYLELYGTGSESETRYTTTVGEKYELRTQYTLGNYPTIAIDFDIMTRNGRWGLYKENDGSINASNSAAFYIRPYINSTLLDKAVFGTVYLGNIGLDATPYLWQHVTVIYEYYTEEVDGVETQFVNPSIYVNGKLTSDPATINMTEKGDASQMFVGPAYFSTGRYGSASSQCFDNIEYTYFQAEYFEAGNKVEDIPSLVYNENWESPFGQYIASVTVGEEVTYFDNFDKAYAFAEANEVELALNESINAPFTVESEITVNLNIYDENGEITGINQAFIDNFSSNRYLLVETNDPGVYTTASGDFAVIDASGNSKIYFEKDFATAFNAVKAGYTVKLLSDIETSSTFKLGSTFNNVTLDLNGYNLVSVSYGGNTYEAVKDETTGEFTFPTDNPTAVTASAGVLFTYNAESVNFTVTSSVPGASITRVASTAETWTYNGEVVKREITKSSAGTFADMTKAKTVLNINNVSVYSTRLVNQGSGSPDSQSIYVTDSNIYMTTTGCYLIYSYHKKNLTLDVKDSMIYFPGGNHGYLFRWVNASSTTTAVTKVRFTNCDIIKGGEHSYGIGMTVASGVNHDMLFDNCRTYDLAAANTIKGANGTLGYYATKAATGQDSAAPAAAEGYEQVDVNITIPYTIPKSMTATATEGLIQSAVIPTETTTLNRTFNKLDTKAVDVNLFGANGEIVKTTQLTPGVTELKMSEYRILKELVDNDFLNIEYQWVDENGNLITDGIFALDSKTGVAWPKLLEVEDEETGTTSYVYNIYAKENINGVVKYVGGIKKASFNLNFLTGFRYNLYIPVDERLSDVVVEGYAKSDVTVSIGGAAYTVYYKLVGSAAAAEDNVITATFKVDGTEYNQSWSINAIKYADMLLDTPTALYPSEAAALGAMAKFIKEAVLYTNPEADVTAIDALIAKSGVASSFDTYTSGNVNALSDLSGIVESVQYVIYNGVASYKFTTIAEDTEIAFATAGGKTVEFDRDGKTVILSAMRVYDVIDALVITSGDKTATFAMVDYLTGMEGQANIDIVKALYEFGVAAEAYTADLLAK